MNGELAREDFLKSYDIDLVCKDKSLNISTRDESFLRHFIQRILPKQKVNAMFLEVHLADQEDDS